jgi:excisionase family DNA binding protein
MPPDAETRVRAALTELGEALIELARQKPPATTSPVELVSVAEAARRAGIGRSSMYLEVQAGRIRSVRVRGRRLVPAAELTRLAEPGAA